MDVLKRLKEGNAKYLNAAHGLGDVSPAIRRDTAVNGQHPYAAVVACSDSRVPVESIFSAGIGELFVVRVAGNVIGDMELASLEYAVEHLGIKDVVILGHSHCGAVGAALSHGEESGYVKSIIDEIKGAIGNESDPLKASELNVRHSMQKASVLAAHIIGAIYMIDSGEVVWLPE